MLFYEWQCFGGNIYIVQFFKNFVGVWVDYGDLCQLFGDIGYIDVLVLLFVLQLVFYLVMDMFGVVGCGVVEEGFFVDMCDYVVVN